MIDQEDNFQFQKCVVRQQSREKNMGLFGTIVFQISACPFVPTFRDLLDCLRLLLDNSSFKTFYESSVWVGISCSAPGYILLSSRL